MGFKHLPLDDLPGEVWKDITTWKGYTVRPGYQVSNKGRVKNIGRVVKQIGRNGKIIDHPYPPCMLALGNDSDGYKVCLLAIVDDKRKTVDCRVHQAVATYFLPEGPKEGQTQVNHKDGNKANNTPENLEWATPLENNIHAREVGLNGPGKSQAIKCMFKEIGVAYFSKAEASLATGYSSSYISDCERLGTQMVDRNTGQKLTLIYL